MNLAMTILRWVVRITGVLQLILGLAFWTGNLLQYIPFHMLGGLVFTLALLVVVVLAAFARVGLGPVLIGVVLVVVVPVLGVTQTQTQILPGDLHWIVQVVHLLVGGGAIGFANQLAGAGLGRRTARPAFATAAGG